MIRKKENNLYLYMVNNKKIGWFLYDKKNERVCIHRRDKKAKCSPEIWDCFGGKIEQHETNNQAFLREFKEELGFTIDIKNIKDIKYSFPVYCVYFNMNKDTHKISLGEGAGFVWVSFDYAFKLDITDEAKGILKKFKKDIKKSP